ncbi:MAG: M23 family metallopeptidase [Firmicutes bacterium]|nr:M23 family metallopeptidase [Bacillota bacterium]
MDDNHSRRWRPGWTLLLLMILVALTVTDESSRLTSDSPVYFTWNQNLLGVSNQGGPDPLDVEFPGELASEDDIALAMEVMGDGTQLVALEDIESVAVGESIDEEAGPAGEEPEEKPEAPEPKPLVLTHVVERGQTLWDIAKLYGIDIDTVVAANQLNDPQRLQVGQNLTILTIKGALHTVRLGDNVWDIARAYQVKTQDIVEANELLDPSSLRVGQRLVIPGAQAVAAQRHLLVASNGQLRRAFDWPARGRISSRYGPRWGRMHYGLDLAVVTGTPVRAAADGRVSWSGPRGTYGNLVIVDHGQRVETRYAHNSRLAVRAGDSVKRGQIIAYSGNTGISTGPHIHFEIRYRGKAVDPEKYLMR